MKQIYLPLSDVAESLWRALLVDELGENLLVKQAPSLRQGGFHRGGKGYIFSLSFKNCGNKMWLLVLYDYVIIVSEEKETVGTW